MNPNVGAGGVSGDIQREIRQDWDNREQIEIITCSIKKIADFLNSFGEFKGYADMVLGYLKEKTSKHQANSKFTGNYRP